MLEEPYMYIRGFLSLSLSLFSSLSFKKKSKKIQKIKNKKVKG